MLVVIACILMGVLFELQRIRVALNPGRQSTLGDKIEAVALILIAIIGLIASLDR